MLFIILRDRTSMSQTVFYQEKNYQKEESWTVPGRKKFQLADNGWGYGGELGIPGPGNRGSKSFDWRTTGNERMETMTIIMAG